VKRPVSRVGVNTAGRSVGVTRFPLAAEFPPGCAAEPGASAGGALWRAVVSTPVSGIRCTEGATGCGAAQTGVITGATTRTNAARATAVGRIAFMITSSERHVNAERSAPGFRFHIGHSKPIGIIFNSTGTDGC
jgi:hypothetical protein